MMSSYPTGAPGKTPSTRKKPSIIPWHLRPKGLAPKPVFPLAPMFLSKLSRKTMHGDADQERCICRAKFWKKREAFINCAKCGAYFHPKCVGLGEMDRFEAAKVTDWSCRECRVSVRKTFQEEDRKGGWVLVKEGEDRGSGRNVLRPNTVQYVTQPRSA